MGICQDLHNEPMRGIEKRIDIIYKHRLSRSGFE